jgi:hypothetical protein
MEVLVLALVEMGEAAADVASVVLLSAWMAFVFLPAAGTIAARRQRPRGCGSAGRCGPPIVRGAVLRWP